MIQNFFHWVARTSYAPAYRRFLCGRNRVEEVQRKKLQSLLSKSSQSAFGKHLGIEGSETYEEFSDKVPLSSYVDYEIWIRRQKESKGQTILANDVSRFEPTSGSSSARKWIPYSSELLSEFNEAASSWLGDLSKKYPAICSGRHYWSLSYLPEDLRSQKTNTDDIEIFSWFKQFVFKRIMVLPSQLGLLPDALSCRMASLVYLAKSSDLTFISVWSPTYLTELLNDLITHKEEIAETLESGQWQRESLQQSDFSSPQCSETAALIRAISAQDLSFVEKLWPKLTLISAWESAHSFWWAQQLKAIFSKVSFQGKGLWATEGVVSIPFEGKRALAYTSHFYEFRCLASGEIIPSWKLKKSQLIQPILTTGSGFMRYALPDKLEVTGFYHSVPCFEFLGRIDGIDLVGEKIDTPIATNILARMSADFKVPFLTLIADASSSRPRYVFLAEKDAPLTPELEDRGESLLQENHHYRVARELNQLDRSTVCLQKNAYAFYKKIRGQTLIEGDLKIEPLIYLNAEQKGVFNEFA